MIQVGCPFEVGETFAVELDALELEVSANVRPIEREGLAELAESIARVGQLAPILVYWTGERFRLAAGFRRVLAMGSHRQRYGFVAVLARRVDADAADLVRLVENFERENPSTFDTCRYLYELNAGLNGRQKRPASEIAEHRGIPVTSVSRTLLDLAAELDIARLREIVNEASRKRLIDFDDLTRVLNRGPG